METKIIFSNHGIQDNIQYLWKPRQYSVFMETKILFSIYGNQDNIQYLWKPRKPR